MEEVKGSQIWAVVIWAVVIWAVVIWAVVIWAVVIWAVVSWAVVSWAVVSWAVVIWAVAWGVAVGWKKTSGSRILTASREGGNSSRQRGCCWKPGG